jgi:hypothetical protein
MRLLLKSSGGVGGLRLRVEGQLETERFPGLENRILELKREGKLGPLAGRSRYPDAQQVVIEVQNKPDESFVVDESSASNEVLQLIDDIRSGISQGSSTVGAVRSA